MQAGLTKVGQAAFVVDVERHLVPYGAYGGVAMVLKAVVLVAYRSGARRSRGVWGHFPALGAVGYFSRVDGVDPRGGGCHRDPTPCPLLSLLGQATAVSSQILSTHCLWVLGLFGSLHFR